MRNTLVATIATILATALIPATAIADRKSRAAEQVRKRFATADANSDGKLTKDEANGKMPKVHANFDQIDSGGKGYVTLDEVMAYGAEQAAAKKAAR